FAAALARKRCAGGTAVCDTGRAEGDTGSPSELLTTRQNLAARSSRVQASDCHMLGHGSGLPRGALDCAHDALIGSAAADVRAHVLDDLIARRLGAVFAQVSRAHDLPGLAVATLRHLLGEPSLLQRV